MSIDQAINILAAVTLIEMMVAIGASVTVAQVIHVAVDWRLVARAGLANYVLVPAAAIGLLLLFGAPPMVAVGFLITAVCPGAPFGPPFTTIAKGNVVAAVGLMVLLAGSSALMAPLLLRVLIPLMSSDRTMHLQPGKMTGTLLGAQLLPLCVGIALRHFRPLLAEKLKKPFGKLGILLNLATFGLILGVQFQMMTEIRLTAYLGMLALVIASTAAGWALGGRVSANRTAMAMATGVRNVGVSLVIATGSFAGTAAVTAATAFAVFQTVVMAIIALIWGRMASSTVPTAVSISA
jgi:BASS family bile acid:Na+ symporter